MRVESWSLLVSAGFGEAPAVHTAEPAFSELRGPAVTRRHAGRSCGTKTTHARQYGSCTKAQSLVIDTLRHVSSSGIMEMSAPAHPSCQGRTQRQCSTVAQSLSKMSDVEILNPRNVELVVRESAEIQTGNCIQGASLDLGQLLAKTWLCLDPNRHSG